MPFDVSRAYDEAKGLDNPRIWTAERDIEMWPALEALHEPGAPRSTQYAFRPARPIRTAGPVTHHPVVIVGGGPVGLALGDRSRLRGVAGCPGRRQGRLRRGLPRASAMPSARSRSWTGSASASGCVEKGVTWQLGKVFWRDRMLYQFNLLPEGGHKMPAFINCQQYYLEQFLYRARRELLESISVLAIEYRCRQRRPSGARVRLETPRRRVRAGRDWLIACDGARSTVRHAWASPSRAECSRTGS